MCKQYLFHKKKKAKLSLKINEEYGYFQNALVMFYNFTLYSDSYTELFNTIFQHQFNHYADKNAWVYNQLIMGVEYFLASQKSTKD